MMMSKFIASVLPLLLLSSNKHDEAIVLPHERPQPKPRRNHGWSGDGSKSVLTRQLRRRLLREAAKAESKSN